MARRLRSARVSAARPQPRRDLIADIGGRLVRVQVKTSRFFRNGRWEIVLATRGGNRSWSGLVKRFTADRSDFVFVHVADGRRWFIPSPAIGGETAIRLGGPKYAGFEVEPGRPFRADPAGQTLSSDLLGRGSRAVKGARL